MNNIKNAFKFGQKNPNATYEDYLNHQSSFITKEDLNSFKDFHYDKISLPLNGKDYEFLVFKNTTNYLNLEALPQRIGGDKSYYLLTPMPGEWYSGICVLHINNNDDNFFNIKNWNLYKENKGSFVIGDDRLTFTFFSDNDEDSDDENSHRYYSLKDFDADKPELIKLWDNQSELHGFINPNVFDWKPINNLFHIID